VLQTTTSDQDLGAFFLRCGVAVFFGLCCGWVPVSGQLRVVSYNTQGGPNAKLENVLQAIGEENVAGIARPIDLLLLQEQAAPVTTTQAIVNLLDSIYGAGSYARSQVPGGPSYSSMRQSLIYNTQTVSLLEDLALFSAGSSTRQPRQTMRYKVRPAGYDTAADFYIYNSHYKALGSQQDIDRRTIEAVNIRNNSDTLGEGTSIIYGGDLNMGTSTEPGFVELTSAGAGQASDPVDQPGYWNGNSSFAQWHTYATDDVDGRYDFQLVTDELLDGEGLSYIPGTYRTFGNDGSIFNRAVTSVSNTYPFTGVSSFSPAEVSYALYTASDHLPVVADYQVPAILDVATSSIPPTLEVGQSFELDLLIRNAADVVAAVGADSLAYSFSTTGAVSGAGSGNKLALGTGTTYALALDTSTAGLKTGEITVTTTSQGAANSLVTIPVNYQVGGEPGGTGLSVTESFENPPGTTYALTTPFDDGSFDFFDRYAVPDLENTTRDDFSGFDGNFAILGQDHDGDGGPSTVSIEIFDIDISSQTDLALTGLFGALDAEPNYHNYEVSQGDGIEVLIAVDGGPPSMIGAFRTNATGSGDLYLDTNLDGIGDDTRLTTSLAEFTFPFSVSGTLLDVVIELTSTANYEPLAVDFLRIESNTNQLAGDYNRDGQVDAADYTVWADNLGSQIMLPGDTTAGSVDLVDYEVWKANFGSSSAGEGIAVTEPASLVLGVWILCGFGSARRWPTLNLLG
jgi:hypothetical protein